MHLLWISALAASVTLTGCAYSTIEHKDGQQTARGFNVRNLAKSEVDMVTELVQRETLSHLRNLMLKLYRRNPQEYRKSGLDSPEAAVERLFSVVPDWTHSPLLFSPWRDRLQTAFDEAYEGDRVYALVSGLLVMTMASYNNLTEFFVTDSLDPQRLYNSARNYEIAVWKLSQDRKSNGELFLLTNSMGAELNNLSFEREFGKLVAGQDLLALIMEDKSNRSILRVIQGTAGFVFLPI